MTTPSARQGQRPVFRAGPAARAQPRRPAFPGARTAERGSLAQGHPVIVQAGASEPGKQLAARTAEVIFAAQITLDEAVAYYADVKGRMAKFGRSPESLHIMPGAFPVVCRTETEAQAKFDELQALIHPAVGLALLSNHLGGIDLSPYPIDGPVPDDLPLTNAGAAVRPCCSTWPGART
ncbi:MAG: LLM class flavin-dependent oxidoreductase [Acetobacteraceae bacterium]